MRTAGRAVRWSAIVVAIALLALALAAPYWNLDRFGQRIQVILEKELKRRVAVGKVRLELFGGPGFSLSDVVIYDDPRAGREPLAYVTALEARVALSSLWTGRLEFASLRLVEPSVNLVKPDRGPWNLEDLISRRLVPAAPSGVQLPSIAVRSGRINFKFADVKSVFYLTNADVDLSPPGPGQSAWTLRFSGEPARSDRPGHGLGRIAGRGRWRPEGRLELTLDLEKSYLEEVSTLLAGRDLGLRGHLTSRAYLRGPIHDLEITGQAQLRDFRRRDLMPPLGGDWDFSYRGRLDLPLQTLALEGAPEGGLPVRLSLRIFDYLSEPRWGVLAVFRQFPLQLAPEALRVAGLSVPESLALEGAVDGAMGYSPKAGLRGTLVAKKASLSAQDRPLLGCARAPVTFDGEQFRFGPWILEKPDKTTMTLEGAYSRRRSALTLKLDTGRSAIAEARSAEPLPGLAPVPLLEACRGGWWQGELRYDQPGAGPPRWTGRLQIQDTQMTAPGWASPLRIAEAVLRIAPSGISIERMRATMGEVSFEAHYEHREKAQPPHRVRLDVRELDLVELERLMSPVLDRRRGLLHRAFRLSRVPAPDWLAARRAEGVFQIETLMAGGAKVAAGVRGHILWDGLQVEVSGLEARVGEAGLKGRLQVDLRQATPAYRFSGAVGGFGWGGGQWGAEGILETSGLGGELLANLRLEGSFLGRSVELTPEAAFDLLAGRFLLRFVRGAPRLRIDELEAVRSGEVLRGECRAAADGRLAIELSSGLRQLRLSATLWPPKIEQAEAR